MTNATTGKRRGLLAAAVDEPVLGRDEERELARRAEAGDADAAGRLIASHLRFVIKIARRYRGSGLPMSDLIQEGTVGLIRAVRRFNPDRGVRLSTYAMWWIRSAIQDHVMHSWSLVRMGTTNAQKALILRLRQMTAELIGGAEGLSDEITARLAKSFGATANEVATLARRLAGGDWSLDQPMAGPDGDQRTWMDCLTSDAPTPEQAVAEASERRFVSEIVGKALAGPIVCGPAPGMLKLIVSVPRSKFACSIAARSVQGPSPTLSSVSHTPSAVLKSDVSAMLSTVIGAPITRANAFQNTWAISAWPKSGDGW